MYRTNRFGLDAAHHSVYETSGILHRDISVGNVMFYRENNTVMGILCDWDLALHTRNPYQEKMLGQRPQSSEDAQELSGQSSAQQEAETGRDRYRTGTGPFMAYELLRPGEVPPHLYRYDLESFFWLLAWFCAVFDPKSHSTKRRSPWDHAELFIVGMKKHMFMSNVASFDTTFENSDPDYRSLAHDWVRKLRSYLGDTAMTLVNEITRLKNKIDLARSLGKSTRADRYSQKLEALQKKDVLKYKRFMKHIGVVVQESKKHAKRR